MSVPAVPPRWVVDFGAAPKPCAEQRAGCRELGGRCGCPAAPLPLTVDVYVRVELAHNCAELAELAAMVEVAESLRYGRVTGSQTCKVVGSARPVPARRATGPSRAWICLDCDAVVPMSDVGRLPERCPNCGGEEAVYRAARVEPKSQDPAPDSPAPENSEPRGMASAHGAQEATTVVAKSVADQAVDGVRSPLVVAAEKASVALVDALHLVADLAQQVHADQHPLPQIDWRYCADCFERRHQVGELWAAAATLSDCLLRAEGGAAAPPAPAAPSPELVASFGAFPPQPPAHLGMWPDGPQRDGVR